MEDQNNNEELIESSYLSGIVILFDIFVYSNPCNDHGLLNELNIRKIMNDYKKKFTPVLIAMTGILIWTFSVMIKSFNTAELWRIIFASIAFITFFILTSLVVYQFLRKIKEEKNRNTL